MSAARPLGLVWARRACAIGVAACALACTWLVNASWGPAFFGAVVLVHVFVGLLVSPLVALVIVPGLALTVGARLSARGWLALWLANGAGAAFGAVTALNVAALSAPLLCGVARSVHRYMAAASTCARRYLPRPVTLVGDVLFALCCEACMLPAAGTLVLFQRVLTVSLSSDWSGGASPRVGRPVVLFVHGLGAGEFEWVFARCLCALHLGLGDGELRSVSLHTSGWGSFAMSADRGDTIELYVSRLAAAVDALVARRSPGSPPLELVLVGHSMGGLVATRWAASVSTRDVRVRGLVAISSPFGGADVLRPVLERPWLARLLQLDAVHRQLAPASAFLTQLCAESGGPPRRVFTGALDWLVRPHSAQRGARGARVLPYATHNSIVLSASCLLGVVDSVREWTAETNATFAHDRP